MNVESVAYIAELKNTLSAIFFLSSFMALLSHLKQPRHGLYAFSVLLFLTAALCKITIMAFPVWLVAYLRWRDGRWTRAHLTLPYFMISVSFAFFVIACGNLTSVQAMADTTDMPSVTEAQRPGLALSCWAFYFWKWIVPVNLSPLYSKWAIAGIDWSHLGLFVLAVGLVGSLTVLRREWSPVLLLPGRRLFSDAARSR